MIGEILMSSEGYKVNIGGDKFTVFDNYYQAVEESQFVKAKERQRINNLKKQIGVGETECWQRDFIKVKEKDITKLIQQVFIGYQGLVVNLANIVKVAKLIGNKCVIAKRVDVELLGNELQKNWVTQKKLLESLDYFETLFSMLPEEAFNKMWEYMMADCNGDVVAKNWGTSTRTMFRKINEYSKEIFETLQEFNVWERIIKNLENFQDVDVIKKLLRGE